MTGPSSRPGERATWRERLDPLGWCEVDRALAIVGVTLVFRIVNAAQAQAARLGGSAPSFLDRDALSRLVPTLWALVGWWAAIATAGLVLRKRRPASGAYAVLVMTSFWATNAGVSIAIGTFHSPFWIVLPGAVVAMMVMFGTRRTFASLAPAVVMIVGGTWAAAAGKMRYAPIFSRPPYDAEGRPEAAWVLSVGGAAFAATLVTIFAAQVLLGRLRAREEELRQLTRTDPLTEVGNRRAFFERMAHELLMRARRRTAIGVVAVDVDHFKSINDRYGHPAGDAALRAVARALTASARQTDFVARMGGEEFALLLPDTAEEGTAVVAERCRVAIESLTLTTPTGDPMPLTATFGAVSLAAGDPATAETMMRVADAALYAGKRDGRNRVVVSAVTSTS